MLQQLGHFHITERLERKTFKGQSARMGKRLSVRAERVRANRIGTILIILLLSLSCTVNQNIYIDMKVNKNVDKKTYFSKDKYKPSKGLKLDQSSETIQDDSISVKEMLEKHVQGLLDPSSIREGQYHGEDVDFSTDTEHLEFKTELEALEYAEQNGMSEQEIENFLKEQSVPGTVEDQVPSTDTIEEATPTEDGE